MSQTKVEAPFVQNNANFRNLFINGDMQIYQRGAASTPDSSGTFALDRWKLFNVNAGAFSVSQDTTVPTGEGFTKSVKWDCTTADSSLAAGDLLIIQQRFEGQMLQHLRKGTSNAKKTTLSFWVRSAKTGTHIVELFDNDNDRQISKIYTVNSADTWEKKEVVFEGDTSGALGNDNAHSLQVNWWLAAGSTYTAASLNTSWATRANNQRAEGQVNLADNTSNNFYLTGVQWEIGDQATDFEHLPHDVQFQRCERYFQVIARVADDTSSDLHYIATGALYQTDQVLGVAHFQTTMRAAPTITITSGSNYYAFSRNQAADYFNDLIGYGRSPRNCLIYQDNANISGTIGHGGAMWCNNASASITASAEL